MTPEARIRAGGVVLVFDAPNVPTRKLFALAKAAKLHGHGLRVVVPVTAHTEKLTRLRHDKGVLYDAEAVRKALEDAGVEILALDAAAAERVAERLWTWFPTRDAMHDARWRRLYGETPRSPHRHVPGTIDWYTAALCPPGGIVVTGDAGAEFRDCEVIGPGALESVLREMADGPPEAAPA
jgi:hypothetical protein